MKRVVLGVATGRYVIGQAWLRSQIAGAGFLAWIGEMPSAFKTFKLAEARRRGSSILPAGPLPELWAHSERGFCGPVRNDGRETAETLLVADGAY